ncbi:MAG: hypothetical protein Q4A30_00245 [Candidatus Saccharibacteria bacterium]|nr:hypothetical protein [Candidatus Saccharibacteria bacterium]
MKLVIVDYQYKKSIRDSKTKSKYKPAVIVKFINEKGDTVIKDIYEEIKQISSRKISEGFIDELFRALPREVNYSFYLEELPEAVKAAELSSRIRLR